MPSQVSAEHGLTPWRVEALFVLGSLEHTRGHPAAPSLAAARELALDAGVLAHAVQADLLVSDAALLVHGPRAALPLVQRAARGAERLRLTRQQAAAEMIAAAVAALAGEQSTASPAARRGRRKGGSARWRPSPSPRWCAGSRT